MNNNKVSQLHGAVLMAVLITSITITIFPSANRNVFALDQSLTDRNGAEIDPDVDGICHPKKPRFFADYVGFPIKGFTITIDGSHSDLLAVPLDCSKIVDLNSPQFYSWQIDSVNAANSFNQTNLQKTNTLTPTLFLEQLGTYKIKFTICPNGCADAGINEPIVNYFIIDSLSSTHIPPMTEPVLPASVLNNKTSHHDPSDAASICTGIKPGGDTPQWRTVESNLDLPNSYKLLEGNILGSHVSQIDNFLNHFSYFHDLDMNVQPDPPFQGLLAGARNRIGTEWEAPSYDIKYWPSVNDRVSIYGYWIYDCGHGSENDHRTEIHPPVFIATHKQSTILIDPTLKFLLGGVPVKEKTSPSLSGSSSLPQTGSRGSTADHENPYVTVAGNTVRSLPGGDTVFFAPSSVGTNVHIPGIVTDVWVNQNGGQATTDCYACLHEKAVVQTDASGNDIVTSRSFENPNPINRVFDFNIYLPASPDSVYKSYGINVPHPPLYCKIFLPNGESRSCFNPSTSEFTISQTAEGSVTFLKAKLDLTNYSEMSYHARVEAGWVYPSPDNWGLESWRFKIDKIHIDDDADIGSCGEVQLYFNMNHKDQPWTKLLGYGTNNSCVDGGTDLMAPRGFSWETGPTGSNAFLGPDILARGPIAAVDLRMGGWEDQYYVDDRVAAINTQVLVTQGEPMVGKAFDDNSNCSSYLGCARYHVDYTTTHMGKITPVLTAKARSLYDKLSITSDNAPKLRSNNLGGYAERTPLITDNFVEDESPAEINEVSAKVMKLDPSKIKAEILDLKQTLEQSPDKNSTDSKEDITFLKEIMPRKLWDKYFAAGYGDKAPTKDISGLPKLKDLSPQKTKP